MFIEVELKIDENCDKSYYIKGTSILHREDGPAIEYPDGTKYWYKEGKLHRLEGPAIELSSGSKFWYKEGKRHRDDGPAYEGYSGIKEFWIDGKHMENVSSIEEALIKNLLE